MNRFIILLIVFSACQQIIDLDEINSQGYPVIEAFINNQDTLQYVRVTQSVAFTALNISPPISNAIVRLLDPENNRFFTFGYQNDGYYLSAQLNLEPNTPYRIQVILPSSDTLISAIEYLPPLSNIDSLHYGSVIVPDELLPRIEIERYYPIVYGIDPSQSDDFYLWRVYKNDTLFRDPDGLVLLEDRFFNGNDFQNDFTSFLYDSDDQIKIELNMISASAYEYLSQFKNQSANQNNRQLAYPYRLNGNIYNQNNPELPVLGLFSLANSKIFKKNIK